MSYGSGRVARSLFEVSARHFTQIDSPGHAGCPRWTRVFAQPAFGRPASSPYPERIKYLMTFNALGLSEQITRSLHQEGYTTPTPIQTQAIPVVLAGRDLIGIAQTGTGKTAAFALPILNMLAQQPRALTPKGTRVLVLSPTRELSAQIKDSFRTYGRHLRLSVTLAIGGTPIGKQIRALAPGVDVLVATPGR